MAGDLADIDWSAPWLAPWRGLGEAVARRVLAGESQPDALNTVAQSIWPASAAVRDGRTGLYQPPVRFAPQADLPLGMAYESYIFDRDKCPTREGLHDFFNGLAWLHLPCTKRRLNQLHAAQIGQTGVTPLRGPARDGLTLFDENIALLRAPDALWHALETKDWQKLFVDLRPLWADAYLVLFGHALLEKLVYPRKPVTAHVYRTHQAIDSIANLDAWLAADIAADKLAAKPFAHLPVLGVPHWWPGNEVPGFYADALVFRAPRVVPANVGK